MSDSWLIRSFRVIVHVLILRPLLRLLFGVGMVGLLHIRPLDQFVISANHNSHLDVFLLFHILPLKHIGRTHPVAAKEYFERSRFIFQIADFLFRPIWISRGEADRQHDPLDRVREVIRAGQSVIVFPEGTRGKPGGVQRFQSGIGRVISEFENLSVLPVFLLGTERALPKASALLLPFRN
ncbi:MAG: lysophospholipid acyltransferase family protein, partial [candidate division Zixibacteria bacterium]